MGEARAEGLDEDGDFSSKHENPYQTNAQDLNYGLLYKRDKFCRPCKQIKWPLLIRKLEERSQHETTIPVFDTPRNLRSMRNGCDLCGHLYWSFKSHHDLKDYWDHGRCSGEDGDNKIHILEQENADVSLCELDGDFNIRISVSSRRFKEAMGLTNTTTISDGITIEDSTSTFDNVGTARNWLHDCTEGHSDCHLDNSSVEPKTYLPTRVIDVRLPDSPGYPQNPSLFITNRDGGQYATLSYVWGPGTRFTASQENLEQLCESIDLEILPKLFQDAIMMCRQIGIQYLWIDALCILQDTPADVQRELETMTEVYRNSTLTLAAVGQRSVHNTLMRSHVPDRDTLKPLDYSSKPPAYSNTSDFFTVYIPFGHPATLSYPIHTRAWCLQETLLSRRILVLGLREMFWFCKSYQRRASEWQSKRRRRPEDYEAELYGPLTEDWILHKDLAKRPYDFWYHTVAKYNIRHRSVPEDKLPAISALSSLMAGRYLPTVTPEGEQNDYLAGLWRADLLHGLLWRGENTVWRRRYTQTPLSPTGIPTWSWAGWDNIEVCWRRHLPQTPDESIRSAPLAIIQHCEVDLLNAKSPFGHVRGGTLVLKGKIAALPYEPISSASQCLSRAAAAEASLNHKGIEVRKFCTCEAFPSGDDWCSECCTGADLNSPECIDESCICLQMTKHEALILSPCYRLMTISPAAEDHARFAHLPFFRVGILVAESELGLQWEEGEREVVII